VSYERTLRHGMIFQAANIWDGSYGTIQSLIERLNNSVKPQTRKKLADSFETLKRIVEAVRFDEGYVKEEDSFMFNEQIMKMPFVFKRLFEAYMHERTIRTESDKIDRLNIEFYRDIARRRKLPSETYVVQTYSPITLLVRFLHNCAEHGSKPRTDHITKAESFGNVYTLCSIFILAVYAYIEILETWIETENMK